MSLDESRFESGCFSPEARESGWITMGFFDIHLSYSMLDGSQPYIQITVMFTIRCTGHSHTTCNMFLCLFCSWFSFQRFSMPCSSFPDFASFSLFFASFSCLQKNSGKIWQDNSLQYHYWLVVWNIFIFPYIENNHPN